MLKLFLSCLIRVLFRFRAYNVQALQVPGPVLLLPNHLSWWDWVLVGVCLDDDWRFVTSSTTARLSWVHRRIMVNRRTFPVDLNSPYAVKHIAEYLQKGGRLVLFPEGQLSRTGSLMKLFEGTGFLISKTHAKVITAYLRGAHRLPFSPNPNRKQLFPRVSIHFSNILSPPQVAHLPAADARMRLTDWLRDRMVLQRFETEMEFGARNVPDAIVQTARRRTGHVLVQDATMQTITGRRLLVGADLLAAEWQKRFGAHEQRIGLLLPNVNAVPVVTLSLWLANKTPALLNYTVGPAVLLRCARLAGLGHILTSRSFLEKIQLDVKPLQEAGIKLLFLEDIRAGISKLNKLKAFLGVLTALRPNRSSAESGATAVILFTSGSEGEPKGVELTHRNLLSNIHQMLSVIDLMDTDRFFNALPLFHSFGLNVGLFLPLVTGSFAFLYLSPLHYRIVPAAFYNLSCTVFFATNTFLNGYARKAHPYDFRALRYLFAGAEKLQETTSETWMRKFGVRVLEGYGVTECSPCISANLPVHPRQGSAGKFLPAIEYRLEPVEGLGEPKDKGAESKVPASDGSGQWASREGLKTVSPVVSSPPFSHAHNIGHNSAPAGRLFVRGPNIMKGYLNNEANARFLALGGWYDTGDIARVDADGFLFILGRLKRFAKISGEMISLTAVEDILAGAFAQYGPRFGIAVVSRPDEAKGEKLVAVTNEPKLTLEALRQAIRGNGLSNLAVPREIKVVPELPHLGTGKVDHRQLERLIHA
jgi:acyl-[acyl-carrier-protein]-phospholipid O-acyltransferase/long-chain-fatty-acid--[acyl-carrier-protein] ligase